MFLASGLMVLAAMSTGIDYTVFMEQMQGGGGDLPVSTLRFMLLIQAIAFLLPAVVFLRVFYPTGWKGFLSAAPPRHIISFVVALFALFAAYPLVELASEINLMIPLPDFLREMDANTTDVIGDALVMHTFGDFAITLILVGILPGITEELVFRGLLQNQVAEWVRNPVVAVWIAACIFSSVHMQFEGFLPRLVLGALLGYLYIWSKSIWVPILVHASNNGIQVAVLYFTGLDLSTMDSEQTMDLNTWVIIGSAGLLFFCYRILIKLRDSDA